MQRLGIPFKQSEKGATPGSLRGSGATYMYTCTQEYSSHRMERQVGSHEDIGILLARSSGSTTAA